jgi:hypothetical protein
LKKLKKTSKVLTTVKMSQEAGVQTYEEGGAKTVLAKFPLRAFIIGLILAVISTMLWVAHTRANLTYNIPWAGLAAGGIDFTLFIGYGFASLIVLPIILSKIGVKLTPTEYAIIYIMVLIGWTGPALFWMWGVQIWTVWTWSGGVVAKELALTGKIPAYWYVLNEKQAEWFFSGGPFILSEISSPILFWSVMAICEGLMTFFLALIFRRKWVETESLPFPFASSAVMLVNMTEEAQDKPGIRMARERLLWIAFLIAVLAYGFNIIHAFIPTIPRIPIDEIDLNPWGGGNIGVNLDLTPTFKGAMIVLNFNPLLIAALFLLPLDILLTTWVAMVVFQWIWPAVGISTGLFPDISAQGAWSVWWALGNEWSGAIWYLLGYGFIQGVAIWVIISSRKYFSSLISSAIKGDAESRIGLFGFIGITVIWLLIMFAQGANPLVITLSVVYFLLVYLGMMRYRTESSPAGGGFWWWNWTNGVFSKIGNWPIGSPEAYVTMNLTSPMGAGPGNIQYALLSTDIVHISSQFKMDVKHLCLIVVLTTVITVIFGGIFYAWWGYAGLRGLGWLNDQQTFAIDLGYAIYKSGTSFKLTVWEPTYIPYIAGVVLAVILMWLKATFATIPFNPLGLIMGCMYMWPWVFTSVLIAWLAKYIIFKTGGTPLYQRLLPGAIGFIGGYWFVKLVMWFIVRLFIGLQLPPP